MGTGTRNGPSPADGEKRPLGERYAAHVLLPAGAAAAIVGGILIAWSEPVTKLPSPALGSPFVLAGEIALALYYGGLLVCLPAVRGMFAGEWPIEVSARGARFQDAVASQQGMSEGVIARLTVLENTVDAQQRGLDVIVERLAHRP